jgi:predicted nucleic acid-binding protein
MAPSPRRPPRCQAGLSDPNTAPPLAETLTEAERLSALHTETIGTRSLDVLHVGSALVLGLAEFLTLDHRQLALAKAAGLKVPAL